MKKLAPVLRVLTFFASLLVVALAQLWLSEPVLPFQPDLGEAGWPTGLALTLLAAPILWGASRPGGERTVVRRVMAVIAWLLVARMLAVAAAEPWTLHRIPQWGGPATMEHRLSAGVWRPLHLLWVLGPAALLRALWGSGHRRRWLLAGVLPWLLALAVCALWLAKDPPLYMG